MSVHDNPARSRGDGGLMSGITHKPCRDERVGMRVGAARLDLDAVARLAEHHYVSIAHDPLSDLCLANYTEKATYDHAWDAHPLLLACRGIVYRPDGFVVARPFPKFFGLSEHHGPFPTTEPEITHKVDGCFNRNTRLSLWDGGTISIGEVVAKKLTPTLIGRDEPGNLIPTQVIGHLASKRKPLWMNITLDRPLRTDGRGASRTPAMWVTPNHHIWVNGVCRPIGEARVGDRLIGHEVRPSGSVLHALEAGLLGDGSITRNGAHHHYQESHKASHRGYVEAIRRWMGPFAVAQRDTVSGHGIPVVWATSRNHRLLDALRAKWYPNGAKQVPTDLAWVDDFAVARWYMDDGSLSHSSLQEDRALFATNGFSQEDVVRLGARLTDLYEVSCAVYQSKGSCLRVNAGRDGRIDRLWEAIAPHIVPCMRYKLPERYRSVPHCPFPTGSVSYEPMVATITAIRFVPAQDICPGHNCGFDIQTTTGNYIAQGVVVHNSMITSWVSEGALQTATRGSFTSDHARFAHHWLSERGAKNHFLPHLTYVFEAIYPANRIVVDYGERAECVLLGLVETATGHNMAHIFTVLEAARLGVPAVPRVQSHPWRALATQDRDNFEGYVAFWPESQLRLKLKLPTYIRLHRLLAGLSEHAVWEALAGGTEALLRQACPEEAWDWFDRIALELCRAFEHLAGRLGVFAAYACTGGLRPSDRADRKVIAERLVAAAPPELRGPCFAYLDGKPTTPLLWKLLEPDGPGSRPSLGRRLEEAS